LAVQTVTVLCCPAFTVYELIVGRQAVTWAVTVFDSTLMFSDTFGLKGIDGRYRSAVLHLMKIESTTGCSIIITVPVATQLNDSVTHDYCTRLHQDIQSFDWKISDPPGVGYRWSQWQDSARSTLTRKALSSRWVSLKRYTACLSLLS
jgi:hypothetical protein